MISLHELLPEQQPKIDMPSFRSGDHVKVHVRVIEGDKERIQAF